MWAPAWAWAVVWSPAGGAVGLAGVLVTVLRALEEAGAAGPGDLVAATGLPRYRVLASVRCLEELGLVEVIYSKGSYRVYRVSGLGRAVLDAVESGASLAEVIERGVGTPTPSTMPPPAGAPGSVGGGEAEATG